MCCLFGLIDYNHTLSRKQKGRIICALAEASEARGIDAAGIAYNSGGSLQIVKHPGPAHRTRFVIPKDARVIMGHTRMTTQGSAKKNENNHPFAGQVANNPFALAHNGVLYNDHFLRRQFDLPPTTIETDSFIAVQLLEMKNALNFDSLRFMAEQVEGSFCFTVLDRENKLYFIKGDNPMCLYRFPKMGIYLYASTKEILTAALRQLGMDFGWEKVSLECGEILCIDQHGSQEVAHFSTEYFLYRNYRYRNYFSTPISVGKKNPPKEDFQSTYIADLKMVAGWCGYEPECVDLWMQDGFTTDEIEEFLYFGEL